MPDAHDFDARQDLAVIVTGVLVADLHDLATVIGSTVPAHKMRPLRLMTLVTLDGSDRIELPIRRSTAARLAARRLPL